MSEREPEAIDTLRALIADSTIAEAEAYWRADERACLLRELRSPDIAHQLAQLLHEDGVRARDVVTRRDLDGEAAASRFCAMAASLLATEGEDRQVGAPTDDEQLRAVAEFHRKDLLALGEHAVIVHPEDVPVDYRPGMKLFADSPPSAASSTGDGERGLRRWLAYCDEDDQIVREAHSAREVVDEWAKANGGFDDGQRISVWDFSTVSEFEVRVTNGEDDTEPEDYEYEVVQISGPPAFASPSTAGSERVLVDALEQIARGEVPELDGPNMIHVTPTIAAYALDALDAASAASSSSSGESGEANTIQKEACDREHGRASTGAGTAGSDAGSAARSGGGSHIRRPGAGHLGADAEPAKRSLEPGDGRGAPEAGQRSVGPAPPSSSDGEGLREGVEALLRWSGQQREYCWPSDLADAPAEVVNEKRGRCATYGYVVHTLYVDRLNALLRELPAGETGDEPEDWRCECGDLNREHESSCFRCGAGRPDDHRVYASPVGGGWDGYRAACHDCDWAGTRVWKDKSAALLDAQRHKPPAPAGESAEPGDDGPSAAALIYLAEGLRRSLRRFGRHLSGCEADSGAECRCGLTTSLDAEPPAEAYIEWLAHRQRMAEFYEREMGPAQRAPVRPVADSGEGARS